MLAHPTRKVGQDTVPAFQLHAEGGIGQAFGDSPFDFDHLFLSLASRRFLLRHRLVPSDRTLQLA
jgi:hypothetical protein